MLDNGHWDKDPQTFESHSSTRNKLGYKSFNSFLTGRAIIVKPAAQRSSSEASAGPPWRGVDLEIANPYNGKNFKDSG